MVATIVLGALGINAGITEQGAAAAPGGHPHLKGAFVHQPLNPVSGNEAFAQLRGKGYEQALANAHAQAAKLPKAPLTPSAAWSHLGPEPINNSFYGTLNSGRVTGFAIAPGSPQTLYLAAAGGGVWSSTNNGSSWSTNTDLEPDIAMGSVAVDPNNKSAIFAGTGEDNECGDCFFGDGILESTNSGSTWSLSNPGGIFTSVNVSSLVVEPGATSLATTEVLAGTSNGLYVSTNGGSTWSAEAGTGWSSGNVFNVVLNSLTRQITIYTSVAGVGIEESTNNGESWKTLTSSPMISGSSFENAAIGIHPETTAAKTTLYASLGSFSGYLGMFKSTNGGSTWSTVTVPIFTGQSYAYDNTSGDSGDQSWYDNVLIVSPTNANIVVAGGIALVESTDGGNTWSNLNGEAFFGGGVNLIHPDQHALAFDGSGNLYIGNDGGAWELNEAGVASPGSISASNYSNLNSNLDITQFYAGTAQSGNASSILAGAQDNGTSLYSSPSTIWPNVLSGDGGNNIIDPADPAIQFAEADQVLYGTTNYWSSATDLFAPKALGGPPTLVPGSSLWVPPLAMVSSTGPTILYGGNVVYKSTNDGSTWSSAPTSYSSGDVSALAVAPSNSSVIYAGFDDGTLQMSRDSGTTWNTLTTPAAGEFITHITVSSTNPDTVYISYGSDFPSFGLNPKILVGTSLGTTPNWTDVTGNLPAGVDSNSVISNGSAGLIVASDAGVFTAPVLNGSSTSWTEVGSNLPNVQVMDLLLNSSGTLIATTHGRGIWTFPFSVTTSPPTTSVLVPAKGATLSGTTATLDASASNATSVEFWILGRLLRLHRPPDRHGYFHPLRMGQSSWNTTTVPNASYALVSEAFNGGSSAFSAGVNITVSNPLSTSVLVPAKGATLSGTTATLDASASNATSVEFWILGGSYGFSGHMIGTATSTPYGWVNSWNTTTVPNASYALVSEAFNDGSSAFSAGVNITVDN